jgi:hypothetical protein
MLIVPSAAKYSVSLTPPIFTQNGSVGVSGVSAVKLKFWVTCISPFENPNAKVEPSFETAQPVML